MEPTTASVLWAVVVCGLRARWRVPLRRPDFIPVPGEQSTGTAPLTGRGGVRAVDWVLGLCRQSERSDAAEQVCRLSGRDLPARYENPHGSASLGQILCARVCGGDSPGDNPSSRKRRGQGGLVRGCASPLSQPWGVDFLSELG